MSKRHMSEHGRMRRQHKPIRMAYVICLLAFVLLLGACSGSDGGTTTTPDTPTTDLPATSTTAPSATTTPPDTTGAPATTAAPADDTADDTATTTTTAGGDDSSVKSPTEVLGSFTGTSLIEVNFGAESFIVDSSGTFVAGSYDCTTAVELAGVEFAARVISTPDGAWIDDGDGFVETEPFSVVDATAGCPADPSFWADFSFDEFPEQAPGVADTVNGVAALRYDLLGFIELSTELGLAPQIDGAEYEEFSLWVAEDGGWLVSMVMRASLSDTAAADAFGLPIQPDDDGATLVLAIDLADIDDPDLVITTP